MEYAPIDNEDEEIGKHIVDAALKVHRTLGSGLLEKIYETCLVAELKERGLSVERQVRLPLEYRGKVIGNGLRLDILVGNRVIIETKAVDKINQVWISQIISQLKLAKLRLGFIINFKTRLIKHGIRRIVV